MQQLLRSSFFACVLAVVAFSGCGPAWKVLRASDPTTLGAANNVAVAFDYSQLIVDGKTVDQFVASRLAEDPKYANTWADLMSRFEGSTLEQLRAQIPSAHLASQGPGDVTITFRPNTLKMGKYIVVSSWPTSMNVSIGAHAGEGPDTDEIQITRAYPASVTQPSVFNHVPHIGQAVGAVAGQFIASKRAK